MNNVSYQTFDPQHPGSSDSEGKWRALRLPDSFFQGARVLDLGCNEGFFCGRALSHGAAAVCGVERDFLLADAASIRFPFADVLNQSWDEPWPEGDWDVVLMLSAVHYAEDQPKLFRRVAESLAISGVFVLECGISDMSGYGWQRATRSDGSTVRFPSLLQLKRMLRSSGLSFRGRGPSVDQSGDPVPRSVIHCGVASRSLLLVTGDTLDGKTSLCDTSGVPYFSVDEFVHRSMVLENAPWTQLDGTADLRSFYKELVSRPPELESFLESLFASLPEDETLIVDVIGDLFSAVLRAGKARGFRMWEARRHG